MTALFQDWRGLPEAARGATVALGNFDGVHLGHRAVLAAAHAGRPDRPLAVLTFEPHPREHFRPDDPPFRLTLLPAKLALFSALGCAFVLAIRFDEAFAAMPAEAFVQEVLHGALGASHLSCGHDFAFGHRRGGDVAMLAREAEALGIGMTVVPPVTDEDGPISSTAIRRLLQDGYPERATHRLGRPWEIFGPVSHGDKRGRTIGFPTANVPLGRQLEPARGVYAVQVALPDGRVVPGVANIGARPTVGGTESRVEAHLFDFAGDLYGQEVGVRLIRFLRAEKKFSGLEELTAQIAADAAAARKLLGA
ncbi:bifunctional riboflavin kinase/FAD synthetase [Pseudoroseomonas ludipueritiae]|uniref:Riboflavin biosynthesis protein n=1 Tax=Pseudoroseomonas ludipueritiae TaxID=198093 RepID=A0ABR7R632_9PROT|nr:bifunctional riboflavin kinase/FAD synthetase [Pseudoroseomonas ludipueritiae]MBC9177214.1 bifunctional riboflavin kinase/FAD synthetase [Pseudoroseomonas ludipueritiae]MCG7363080.1 bifunctional riboflavin kinase/FAD synthetase [Roseomonas sp. ACRSG]